MSEEEKRFEQRRMEEYKALRTETIRCAGIISNAVWIGITQFTLTVAAATNFAKDSPELRLLFLILISIQAIAATSMFLSELWKYARIGRYIREKIESEHKISGAFDFLNSPMSWEAWINSKHAGRSRVFTLVSLFILQIPIIICSATILAYFFPPVRQWLPELASIVPNNAINWRSLLLLILITVVDLLIVFRMRWKIDRECRLGLVIYGK
jgi:hypothetical protein